MSRNANRGDRIVTALTTAARMSLSSRHRPLSVKGMSQPNGEVRTDSTSLMIFRHYIVEVLMRRTASTSLRSLTVSLPFRALPTAVAQLLSARVNAVGNRWQPHHGGFHE